MELKELMARAFIEAVPQRSQGEAEFLSSIETDELRRAYFICLIIRMPLDELKKMKEEKKSVHDIESQRNEYIVKLATDLDPMAHKMSSELSRMNDLIEENLNTSEYLKYEVAEAWERERSTLHDQIAVLKAQLKRDQMLAAQYMEDARNYQKQAEAYREKADACREKIDALAVNRKDMEPEKQVPDQDGAEEIVRRAEKIKEVHAVHEEPAGFMERRRRKRRQEEYELEMDSFIQELISKKELSKEQKDYLLSALEEGYSFKTVRRMMIPTLTVEQMEKFIKIYDKRIGGKK